jgi:predicted aldo/keto reductase-like oxidoreductase
VSRKPQVHISVEQQKKEKWKNFAEESPHDNLSQLIRYAVDKEIQQVETSPDTETTQSSEDIEQVVSQINDLDRTLRAIDNSMLTSEEFNEVSNSQINRIETVIDEYIVPLENELDTRLADIRHEIEQINEEPDVGPNY